MSFIPASHIDPRAGFYQNTHLFMPQQARTLIELYRPECSPFMANHVDPSQGYEISPYLTRPDTRAAPISIRASDLCP